MTTTDTPRTDACPHCGSPRISPLCAYFTCVADTTQRDEDKRTHLCREREKSQKLEAEVEELANKYFDMEAACADHMEEVERLKELLNRAINEIEKTPFHTPKLTAFTAHRLADRYREKMTNTSTKPIESQEDDK